MEVLVGGQVGDLDLEQVVVVPGDVVAVDDFAQLEGRALERDHVGISYVTANLIALKEPMERNGGTYLPKM